MMRPPFRFRAIALAMAAAILASSVALAQPAAAPPGATAPSGSLPTGLSADLFYRLLLGDIALQRGDPAVAARAYLEVARELNDARLARRATEIAYATRQRATAEQAARLWHDLEPDAERPQQILQALASGRAGPRERDPNAPAEEDLKSRLEKLLADQALSGAGVGEA